MDLRIREQKQLEERADDLGIREIKPEWKRFALTRASKEEITPVLDHVLKDKRGQKYDLIQSGKHLMILYY